MADLRTQWQLRFRSPMSETKGVDDIIIETDTDDPADAKTLADWTLTTKFPSPGTRFIFVRRNVVATTKDMKEALAPPKPPKPEKDEPPARAQAASRGAVAPKKAKPGDKEQRPTDFGAGAATDPSEPAAARGRVGA